jgi:hydroxymethylglutaryl-CoA lyase
MHRRPPARVYEVGARDGLQNEARQIPTADKIALVDRLSACGFEHIEVTSFVSPRRVPQLADAPEVLAGIARRPGVRYAALTPNLQGYARARAARVDEVAVFASASEGFSRHNINCTIAESLQRFAPLLAAADADGIPVRGYVSCVIACPYDGPVAPAAVIEVARRLLEMGCYEVSLGDTIGAGTPETVANLLAAATVKLPAARLAGHFHDTGNTALANVEASLAHGLRTFDAAVAGLGGCPFAPGAKGNVASGAVVRHLEALGYATGIDLERLDTAERFAAALRSAGGMRHVEERESGT